MGGEGGGGGGMGGRSKSFHFNPLALLHSIISRGHYSNFFFHGLCK